MDKLVSSGSRVTISNDGATIMRLLEVEHPAAKTLVDISMSQDAEVGDGTTSVVLLAVEILKQMKPFVEEGIHPQILIRNIRSASKMAVDKIADLAVKFDTSTPEGKDMLLKTASSALNSKLIASHQDLSVPMIVDMAPPSLGPSQRTRQPKGVDCHQKDSWGRPTILLGQ
jgi:T-complex protein 1 subunit eta